MRYILHPGYIISPNDGDEHYIGAVELARLYNVDLKQCLVIDKKSSMEGIIGRGFRPEPGDIHLFPRPNGDYEYIR